MTDVFIASNIPTDYPRKLQKPSTVNDAVRDTATTFIMDSGIGDDVSNERVLDLADKYDAEFVVPKDYLHDRDRTTASVQEFVDLYASHACRATPLIPLQPPHGTHYEALSGFSHYVLGGMASEAIDTSEQLRWIRDFRAQAGDVYAHGLGVGGGIDFVQQLAGTSLLDSVDCATPEMAAMYGCVLDKRLRQSEVRVMSGPGARKRNKALAEFNSYQIQDVWEREGNREGLSRWQ